MQYVVKDSDGKELMVFGVEAKANTYKDTITQGVLVSINLND